jgi:hypothetical protein
MCMSAVYPLLVSAKMVKAEKHVTSEQHCRKSSGPCCHTYCERKCVTEMSAWR